MRTSNLSFSDIYHQTRCEFVNNDFPEIDSFDEIHPGNNRNPGVTMMARHAEYTGVQEIGNNQTGVQRIPGILLNGP